MAAPLFHFTTVWHFGSDLATVWNHVALIAKYPQWWPGIKGAELTHGNASVIAAGNEVRFVVASPLYTLHYSTKVIDFESGKYILVEAMGDLLGTGRWDFTHTHAETQATFTWNVALTPPLLASVSYLPFVRPVMRFFHNRLMAAGGRGLAQLLNTPRLVSTEP